MLHTFCRVRYTLYSIHYAVYNVHCTLINGKDYRACTPRMYTEAIIKKKQLKTII